MQSEFFRPYQSYRLGKGTSVTTDYLGALRAEGFVVTTDHLTYYLTNPKGEVVYTHIACKNGWVLFLQGMPKILLSLKKLKKYLVISA